VSISVNRHDIFAGVRKVTRHLDQTQVVCIDAIIDEFLRLPGPPDPKYLTYMLATAWHESHFRPVRETFAKSDKQAIRRLNRAYPHKRGTSKDYWTDGYFGRGLVQLTWRRNYQKMGELIGVDLVRHPEKALEPKIAAKVLVVGMWYGLFTGRRLYDFNTFHGMRKTVNGLDHAGLIANYATRMQHLIEHAFKQKPPIVVHLPKTIQAPPEVLTARIEDVKLVVNGKAYNFVRSIAMPEKLGYPLDDEEFMTPDLRPKVEAGLVDEVNAIDPPKTNREDQAMDAKPFYQSKTIWGAIIMVLTLAVPPVLNAMGMADWAEAVKTQDWLKLVQLAAVALVTYGRHAAFQKLKWPRISMR